MDLTLKTETFGQDDQSWLASAEGTDRARTITLDLSTFAGADYTDGYLKSGWTLRKLGSGKYGKRSDGDTEAIAGHLLTAVRVPTGATKVAGALLWHGAVYAAKVPNPPNAAGQATAKAVSYF
ncbi:potassium transporter [Nocardia sp. CDC159]|uniref:Potassium transporter n=1 Tax=Nocardia pulmonis TaxID=2951408 RepID=A0A9X2EFL9_9NOCA|nr:MULTISPECIES: potassium transporter [Nocardia]MCM6778038.1 potassium transporter [Nocardia pulmonis]MCM6790791.1 potassium transporter [Nocardia sp. CDC159]